MEITLLYASIFVLFALFLSFGAGSARGKSGISLLYGDPADMQLVENVRRHQNFLEYVPMFLILFAAVEASGGSSMFLYVVGDLMIVARIAHAIGLKHDNMGHVGRFVGAFGTLLISVATAGYGLWLVIQHHMA